MLHTCDNGCDLKLKQENQGCEAEDEHLKRGSGQKEAVMVEIQYAGEHLPSTAAAEEHELILFTSKTIPVSAAFWVLDQYRWFCSVPQSFPAHSVGLL